MSLRFTDSNQFLVFRPRVETESPNGVEALVDSVLGAAEGRMVLDASVSNDPTAVRFEGRIQPGMPAQAINFTGANPNGETMPASVATKIELLTNDYWRCFAPFVHVQEACDPENLTKRIHSAIDVGVKFKNFGFYVLRRSTGNWVRIRDRSNMIDFAAVSEATATPIAASLTSNAETLRWDNAAGRAVRAYGVRGADEPTHNDDRIRLASIPAGDIAAIWVFCQVKLDAYGDAQSVQLTRSHLLAYAGLETMHSETSVREDDGRPLVFRGRTVRLTNRWRWVQGITLTDGMRQAHRAADLGGISSQYLRLHYPTILPEPDSTLSPSLSIETLLSDMALQSDETVPGIGFTVAWNTNDKPAGRVTLGTIPAGVRLISPEWSTLQTEYRTDVLWNAFQPLVLIAEGEDNTASNSGVALRSVGVYAKYKSKPNWVRVPGNGDLIPIYADKNTLAAAGSAPEYRIASAGHVELRLPSAHASLVLALGSKMPIDNVADLEALHVRVDGRLIIWNTASQDDRGRARFVLHAAGRWYPTPSTTDSQIVTRGGVPIALNGRLRRLDRKWNVYTATTIDSANQSYADVPVASGTRTGPAVISVSDLMLNPPPGSDTLAMPIASVADVALSSIPTIEGLIDDMIGADAATQNAANELLPEPGTEVFVCNSDGIAAAMGLTPAPVQANGFTANYDCIVSSLTTFAAKGHAATNAGVEMRRMFVLVLRKSTGRFHLLLRNARGWGVSWVNSTVEYANGNQRYFTKDSTFCKPQGARGYELMPRSSDASPFVVDMFGSIDRSVLADMQSFIIGAQVRVALDDLTKADDRANAFLVARMKGDIYRSAGYSGQTVDGSGYPLYMMRGVRGRWKRLTTDWQWITASGAGGMWTSEPTLSAPWSALTADWPYNDAPLYNALKGTLLAAANFDALRL